MKKLLMLLTMLFFSLLAMGQKTTPDTTKMSNYEKYLLQQGQTAIPSPKISKDTVIKKKEWDDIYFNSKTDRQVKKNKKHRDDADQIVDTLVQENPDINVNYYYNYDDPFFYSYNIGRFYHGGFNYWMYSDPWIYNNYFGMMDINDWYWEYRFLGYPYWLYPEYNYLGLMLWGGPWEYGRYYNYWNPWRFNHNHWNPWRFNNDQWNHGSYPYYGNNLHQSNPGNAKYRHIEAASSYSAGKRALPQTKSAYSANRRAYTPSYNAPARSVRPEYNNSRASMPTQRSSRNANPAYNSRSAQRNYSSGPLHRSESRSYSVPSRSQNSSYSSGSNSRSSNSYSSGSSYSRSSSSGSSNSSSSSGSRSTSSGSSGRR